MCSDEEDKISKRKEKRRDAARLRRAKIRKTREDMALQFLANAEKIKILEKQVEQLQGVLQKKQDIRKSASMPEKDANNASRSINRKNPPSYSSKSPDFYGDPF